MSIIDTVVFASRDLYSAKTRHVASIAFIQVRNIVILVMIYPRMRVGRMIDHPPDD